MTNRECDPPKHKGITNGKILKDVTQMTNDQ